MGCWNGTCGLTNLPIIYGEEMFVFPIVETKSDSFCYSTALYRPSVLPFKAIYDDYGAGQDSYGSGLFLLMDGIHEKLIELDVGENEYHDIAVKKQGFNVDTFFLACQKHRLQFKNPMRGYPGQTQHINVFFTMIRKDVVDRLWSEWTFDLWKPDALRKASNDYYEKDMTYERLADMIPEYMEQCASRADPVYDGIANMTKDIGDEEAKLFRDYFNQQYFFENNKDHLLSGSFRHAFGSGYSGGGFAHFSNVKDYIIDCYLLEGNKETAYDLMKDCLIGIMVNSFMEDVRKIWLPPMHQGSQSECYEEYQLLHSIKKDIITARTAEFHGDE